MAVATLRKAVSPSSAAVTTCVGGVAKAAAVEDPALSERGCPVPTG